MATFQFSFPFFPIQFSKEGAVFAPAEVNALLDAIASGASRPTDLFVMSHGWNNNAEEAQGLYCGLAGQLASMIRRNSALAGRSFACCGVLWPSKKFEEQDLIPSGAASLNDAVTGAQLAARIRSLNQLCNAEGWPVAATDEQAGASLAEVLRLAGEWEDDPAARRQAVALIRRILPPSSADKEDASDVFLGLPADQLLDRLSRSLKPPPAAPRGANAASLDPFSTGTVSGLGGAAGFRDVLGGVKAAFWHLLNFATYYLMKDRAGCIGAGGLKPLLENIRGSRPDLRIHLVGHSFGCRVVTSAVSALSGDQRLNPDTMTLLQGAFSHYGFAAQYDDAHDGAFRNVIAEKRVRGPILITHTRNDKAVGIAYPIASRIAGQVAAALGDENDIYGGLGSNGAQKTPERVAGTLLGVDAPYVFAGKPASTLYNLRADACISSHGDIVKPEVAYAVAAAMTLQ